MTDDELPSAEELIEETNERYEAAQERKEEFLETVKDDSDEEVVETSCNLVGDMVVDIRAKRNGELIDRMGHIEETLEAVEAEEEGTYRISEVADEASQLLADTVQDSGLDKEAFYIAYSEEGIDELGKMIENVFESIEKEVEKQRGSADGFRSES
jgi:hypothetical protein